VDRYRCDRLPVTYDAFFGDEGFDVESWPLDEQVDVLAALVLHEGFTVNWDFDVA
jgi:hypothetical protein